MRFLRIHLNCDFSLRFLVGLKKIYLISFPFMVCKLGIRGKRIEEKKKMKMRFFNFLNIVAEKERN